MAHRVLRGRRASLIIATSSAPEPLSRSTCRRTFSSSTSRFSATFTVSFIVPVPSTFWARFRRSSSMSTSRFTMKRVYPVFDLDKYEHNQSSQDVPGQFSGRETLFLKKSLDVGLLV